MAKSPDAFRTISEVAEWLGVQAHVLRFWESKFSQVKPIKRAGGRRYYRPNDMLLLGGIRHLLYEDGLTIKGVQKVLREEGMNHVAALSQPLEDPALVEAEIQSPAPEARMVEEAEEARGVVLNFDAKEPAEEAKKAPQALEGEPEKSVEESEAAAPPAAEPTDESAAPETAEEAPVEDSEPEDAEPADADAAESAEAQKVETPPEEEPAAADEAAKAALPAFLRRPLEDRVAEEASEEEAASEPEAEARSPEAEPESEPAPARKPRKVEVGPFRAEEDFPAEPGTLSAAYRLRRLTPEDADSIAPLLDRLSKLRDQMASNRRNAP